MPPGAWPSAQAPAWSCWPGRCGSPCEGPAHLSGLVWPSVSLGYIGGLDWGSFVSPQLARGSAKIYLGLGGYEGSPLPSGGYLGWTLLVVLAGGLVAFWRDRRLWFFGGVLAVCVWCSLRTTPGRWTLVPADLFARLPLIENVIEQRFMAVGYLAAGVMLAVVVDRVHALAPDWRGALGRRRRGRTGAGAGRHHLRARPPVRHAGGPPAPVVHLGGTHAAAGAGPAVLSGALLGHPIGHVLAGGQPHDLRPGRWGRPARRGPSTGLGREGFTLLAYLGFGVGVPEPGATAAQLAAVRHALSVWQVTTVVVATDLAAPGLQQGRDPTYAAAFFTAALGRLPTIQAGAWVWDNVQLGLDQPWPVGTAALTACVDKFEGPAGRVTVNLRVAECVEVTEATRAAATKVG